MSNPYISDPKDVEIEAAIHRAVRNLGVGIHVTVKSGHVSLSGIVDDFETKRDIMGVVRDVAGGFTISNNIRVARVAD
jgi:osmotically-inducible protein OsmY